MEKIKCLKCGNNLQWCDTIDVEGSLNEEYLTEICAYECEKCKRVYRVVMSATVDSSKINVDIEWTGDDD